MGGGRDWAGQGSPAGPCALSGAARVDAPARLLAQPERRFARIGQAHAWKLPEGDPGAGVLSLTDTYGNRVDLLVGLNGPDPGAFSRTIELIFHDVELRVVGLEDFIAMKVFAGGPQDLADARAAIAAAGGRLDLPLATTLAQRFGRDVAVTLTLGKMVAENIVKK